MREQGIIERLRAGRKLANRGTGWYLFSPRKPYKKKEQHLIPDEVVIRQVECTRGTMGIQQASNNDGATGLNEGLAPGIPRTQAGIDAEQSCQRARLGKLRRYQFMAMLTVILGALGFMAVTRQSDTSLHVMLNSLMVLGAIINASLLFSGVSNFADAVKSAASVFAIGTIDVIGCLILTAAIDSPVNIEFLAAAGFVVALGSFVSGLLMDGIDNTKTTIDFLSSVQRAITVNIEMTAGIPGKNGPYIFLMWDGMLVEGVLHQQSGERLITHYDLTIPFKPEAITHRAETGKIIAYAPITGHKH